MPADYLPSGRDILVAGTEQAETGPDRLANGIQELEADAVTHDGDSGVVAGLFTRWMTRLQLENALRIQ